MGVGGLVGSIGGRMGSHGDSDGSGVTCPHIRLDKLPNPP